MADVPAVRPALALDGVIVGFLMLGMWITAIAGTSLSKHSVPGVAQVAVQSGHILLRADKAGTVKALAAKDGAMVQTTDELIFLDDEKELADLAQAQNELQTLASNMRSMDIASAMPAQVLGGVILPSLPGNFAPEGHSERITPQPGKVGSLPRVGGADTPPSPPDEAPEAGPDAGARTSGVSETERQVRIERATQRVAELNTQRDDARMAGEEAQRNLATAELATNQANQEVDRQRMLLQQGVVAANKVSRAEFDAMQAKAQSDQLKAKVTESTSLLATLDGQIEQAKRELQAAQTLKIAAPSTQNSPHNVTQRTASLPSVSSQGSLPHVPRPARVVVREQGPQPIPTRVDLDLTQMVAADAKLAGAKKRVDQAENALLLRRIYAERGMRIVRFLVKPGEHIQPGQPLIEFEPIPEWDVPELVGPHWDFHPVYGE